MTKTHSSPFISGQTGTFTLNVKNSAAAGPTTDTVTITDTLPAGLTATGASRTGWTCNPVTGQTVTCTRPGSGTDTIPAGGAFPPITVNVTVAITAAPTVVNTARVTTSNDSNAANDMANDYVPIIQV